MLGREWRQRGEDGQGNEDNWGSKDDKDGESPAIPGSAEGSATAQVPGKNKGPPTMPGSAKQKKGTASPPQQAAPMQQKERLDPAKVLEGEGEGGPFRWSGATMVHRVSARFKRTICPLEFSGKIRRNR